MINLNFKAKTLSLFMVFCVAILFTACQDNLLEEDKITTEEFSPTLELNETLRGHSFALPNGFETFDEEVEYLKTVTNETSLKLIDNYKISLFLQTEELYVEVTNKLTDFEHLSDMDLSQVLTPTQLDKFETFDANSVTELRVSCHIQTGYCYTRKRCCHRHYCWISWSVPYC